MIVGRYDPNDYQNVLGYVNPWTIFSNLAINLDASVALPDSSWGIGAGHWLNDTWYVLGSINDANGAGSDDLEFFKGALNSTSTRRWAGHHRRTSDTSRTCTP